MTGTTFLPPFLDFLPLPFEKKLETVIQMRHFVKFGAVCTIKKNVKNTHGGVILLVKLKALASNSIKRVTHLSVFHIF